MSDVNFVSGQVVDAAFQIHYKLGPGLFESVYERLLARSLLKRGLAGERQTQVCTRRHRAVLSNALSSVRLRTRSPIRADLLVDGCVLVEVKSAIDLTPVYFMQVHTYLRLLDYPVGLMINFNVDLIKHGIKRMINDRSTFGKRSRLPPHEEADPVQRS